MTSAEVKRVLCAVPAADGSAGLFKSCIFHSTRIVIRTYFSSSPESLSDSPLWNESQKSTGGSNKTNYFKLPIVTVPGWGIEPSCARNAVTGNPCYYHSKKSQKGTQWCSVSNCPESKPPFTGLRSSSTKGRGSTFTMHLQNCHFLLESPPVHNCSWLQHSLALFRVLLKNTNLKENCSCSPASWVDLVAKKQETLLRLKFAFWDIPFSIPNAPCKHARIFMWALDIFLSPFSAKSNSCFF